MFGVGRDETGPLDVEVRERGRTVASDVEIAVTPRDWPIERINGVPPKTVDPPPAIAERIKREQAVVVAARVRDDDRADFAQAFVWPVQGRISGRFGNQRAVVQRHSPEAPHSGMDIAAPAGHAGEGARGGHRHVRRIRTSTSPAARC